jgi:hypothetical protein
MFSFPNKKPDDVIKDCKARLDALATSLVNSLKVEEEKEKKQKTRALLYSKYADLVRSVCSIFSMSVAETVVTFTGC